MPVLLKCLYFYICPVSVYSKKPVPVGAYLVGAFSASTCGKCCKIWRLMHQHALLTGNWLRGPLHFTIPSNVS